MNEDDGAAVPEYVLLLILIALVCISAATLLGHFTERPFDKTNTDINPVLSTPGPTLLLCPTTTTIEGSTTTVICG